MTLTTILIIVNVFAALAIIVLALMQTSKGDMGSAFGGGGSQSMFGSRGSSNFLSRSTAIMCATFFLTSLALAYVYAKRAESNSVVAPSVIEQQVEESDIPTVEVDTPESDVPVIGADDIPEVPLDASGEIIEQAADAAQESLPEIEIPADK